MASVPSKCAKLGLSPELNTKINHLKHLFEHLPETLPLDPIESKLSFGLDENDIADEGYAFAFNQRMEISFESHTLRPKQEIKICERGKRMNVLIEFFQMMTKKLDENEQQFYLKNWIDRCMKAAHDAGAKILNKKRKISPPPANTANLASSKRARVNRSGEGTNETGIITIDLASASEDENHAQASPQTPAATPTTNIAPTSGGLPPSAPTKQATLFDVGCKQTTSEEALKVQRRITELYGEDAKEVQEREEKRQERKKAKVLECGRIRQQNFRDQKKALRGGESSAGRRAKMQLLANDMTSAVEETADLAEISRPDGRKWKEARTGKEGGVIQRQHSRVNWYHPLFWEHIDEVAPKVQWSPTKIAHVLSHDKPQLFKRLHKGMVGKWLSKNKKGWSAATLQNVAQRCALAGSGQVRILTNHPDIVTEIKTKLEGLHKSGISISQLLMCSILLAMIGERRPSLLERFKCSGFYVGQFLESVMDWTVCHGTRAAAHIPADANIVCECAFFCIVHLVNFYDIPSSLIINMDQTGVIILMTKNQTYDQKGK